MRTRGVLVVEYWRKSARKGNSEIEVEQLRRTVTVEEWRTRSSIYKAMRRRLS